jgi:hypothetical protein
MVAMIGKGNGDFSQISPNAQGFSETHFKAFFRIV